MFKIIIYGLLVLMGFIFFQRDPITTLIIVGVILIIYIFYKNRKSKKFGGGVFRKGDNVESINNNLIKMVLFMNLLNQNQSKPLKLIIKKDDTKFDKVKDEDLEYEKNQVLKLFDKYGRKHDN